MEMDCKICGSEVVLFYKGKVLNKYEVEYYKCSSCGFIQTEKPYWLEEAYKNVITQLDIGLVSRNIYLRETIPALINKALPNAAIMLDYGGGYGMFVRMMRDMGYDFYRQDLYCENIFAKYFDVSDINVQKFDILTAFEVFEHLENPLNEITKMFDLAPNIIFSTDLNDNHINEFKNWWYLAAETGQHISFYNIETLKCIAQKFNKHLYTNNNNLHLFLEKPLSPETAKYFFSKKPDSFLQKVFKKLFPHTPVKEKPSLLQSDYEAIKKKLQ